MKCKKHTQIELKCLAGHSAHPNNWYCPMCDMEDKTTSEHDLRYIALASSAPGFDTPQQVREWIEHSSDPEGYVVAAVRTQDLHEDAAELLARWRDNALKAAYNRGVEYATSVGWISINDRLPEDGQLVDVVAPTFCNPGRITDVKFECGVFRAGSIEVFPSHWMPVPGVPK